MREFTLTPGVPEDFLVDINGVRYGIALRFNTRAADDQGLWMADLRQGTTELLTGVPFVLGTRLFRGYEVPGVPEDLILVPLDQEFVEADFNTLGGRVRLTLLEPGDALYGTSI